MVSMRFKKWLEWAVVHDDAINRSQYLKLFDPKRLSTVNPDNKFPGQQQEDPMRPNYLPKKRPRQDNVDRLFGFTGKSEFA